MKSHLFQKDIVVLVADKNMEFTIKGLLLRTMSLGVRQLTSDIYTHPEHDPGCLLRCHDFLRPFINKYAHALVVLDYEGCGQEKTSRVKLESKIEENLSLSGWGDRAAAIIIAPELETWVWSKSPIVDNILGWEGKNPDLRSWLISEDFLASGQVKPKNPKMAFEQALRYAGKARSSSLYYQLAKSVSVGNCSNPSFIKLRKLLEQWSFKDSI